VNVPAAGTYDLHVTSKNYNIRGIWQLTVDGVNTGPPEDEYSAYETYVDFDVGPVVVANAGNHLFRFTVTGRNAKSTDYKISFDTLKFNAR